MANTIEKTTDEALLRSIIDGSIEEFEDDSVTIIGQQKFSYCSNLKKVTMPNVTTLNTGAFSYCSGLEEIDLEKVTTITGLDYCSSLKRINCPVATSIAQNGLRNSGLIDVYFPSLTTLNNGSFIDSRSLTKAFFPNLTSISSTGQFVNCNLQIVDLGSARISSLMFSGNTNFNTLILRKTTGIQPLENINGFNATRFAVNKSGGEIYIPRAMYEHLGDNSSLDYKAATNWSTINGYGTITWKVLEDAPWYNLGAYGLIGYYAVGESGKYEAIENVPSHINSSVDGDLVAFTHAYGNPTDSVSSTQGTVPSNFYNGQYAEGTKPTLAIYSDTAFLASSNSVLTIEYLISVNTDNGVIRTNIAGGVKSSITSSAALTNGVNLESYGFSISSSNLHTTGSNRMFMHKVVELHGDNTYNVYINGQLEGSNQTYNNISTMNFINVGLGYNNGCLGPVAVYNRALSFDEIAEHYQFYVDNYMVGQTAFDSEGNFVGGE